MTDRKNLILILPTIIYALLSSFDLLRTTCLFLMILTYQIFLFDEAKSWKDHVIFLLVYFCLVGLLSYVLTGNAFYVFFFLKAGV